jgi:hypothetical protein
MAESKSTAATTDHVKGKDINGQMVTLERTQPRQLSLFQTFLPDEERYSNTIDLYDALPLRIDILNRQALANQSAKV